MAYFPMMTDLSGAETLVIGGGEEGTKKVRVLKDFGARVTLIAPEAREEAVREADRYARRGFETADLDAAEWKLVVAATENRELNRRISEGARERRIPVNVVDDPELCSFIFPAVIRDRNVICSISSGGKSPYVAQLVKEKVRGCWPEGIGRINDRMGEYREQAKREYADREERRRFLRERLMELLNPGTGTTGFTTALLHGGEAFPQGGTLPPVAQVNAFRYERMEDLERVFEHRQAGYAYSRIGNPTVTAFEQRINALEHGQGAVACASGMAALTAAILAVCRSGDEIIAGRGLYGGTIDLFHDLEQLGIHTVFAEKMTGESIRPLITEKTRLVFGEVISNPAQQVLDIPSVAAAAHEAGLPLFVDSTTATPWLIRPLEKGADAVIHSSSKYINGGGNAIGGIIVDGGKFDWNFEKHTALAEFRKFRRRAFMVRLRTDLWENLGGCMAPMNAFLSYIGCETLGLRMKRICGNAAALARVLAGISGIRVNYLGLEQHPDHALAGSLMNGFGGILNFRAGSRERAYRIINALKYAAIASNIGDVRTLVIHPASTLYIRSGVQEREAAGVFDDTVRVSVGIEDPEDLIADFRRAVEAGG